MSNDKPRTSTGDLLVASTNPRRPATLKTGFPRLCLAVLLWVFLIFFAGVPTISAQEGNAVGLGLLVLAIIWGVFLLCMLALLGSSHGARATVARARWAARSIGRTLPQPRTIVMLLAVTIVTPAVTALLRGPILDLVVATAGTDQSPAQRAADADRSTWSTSGWAGHIPGPTLMSGVVFEELMFRGPLVAAVVFARRCIRSGWPKWAARILIAVLWIFLGYEFGIGHDTFSALNAALMVVAGLLWGVLAIWTKSLLPSIASHALYNLFADW
ncbi:CPBP family intramembrane metalloprotease (plasmid) [Rhodococcus pseudokoreensis]|uniref:CPBP family intramembrane metalloprotease n=1 Tax=Rhodococcus pseudokoreensis TaxID=2811421 RepID=A0A974VXQ5_9NOCA|nr:CPBP family intramembrane glutamic endopeptidase [Rhodococcus pseudokoreensis]QSE87568.1 CPBP family intramembrane metalloprotease [Rhodococcus pseudokoreensis]